MTHAEAFRTLVTRVIRSDLVHSASRAPSVRAAAGAAAARDELGAKWRADAVAAAELASVYLRLLRPPSPWSFRPAGLHDDIALLWEHDDGRQLADLVATGERATALWTPRTTAQPRAALRAGRDAWGDAFVGVRVLALRAPARSLLVDHPSAPPQPLTDTDLWTGAPALSGEDITMLTEVSR